jgi:glycosyltransferase involved in cell wall biosynthesis
MIDIILPCLDEAGALPWVLDRIPSVARAIVVDNGSTDGSPAIARAHGALVVDAAQRGYGAACHAGLMAATADLVAFCDCDASLDPGAVVAMAASILAGIAEMVVGRRRPVNRSAWSTSARFANWELARRIRRRTGFAISDLGPLRIARRQDLLALDLQDRRSGYPLEMLVRAADEGWRVDQFDVDYHPRIGRSKVTGTLRGSLQAVRDMSAVLAT